MTSQEALDALASGGWDYHELAARWRARGTHPAVAAVLAADRRLSAERKEQREAA